MATPGYLDLPYWFLQRSDSLAFRCAVSDVLAWPGRIYLCMHAGYELDLGVRYLATASTYAWWTTWAVLTVNIKPSMEISRLREPVDNQTEHN